MCGLWRILFNPSDNTHDEQKHSDKTLWLEGASEPGASAAPSGALGVKGPLHPAEDRAASQRCAGSPRFVLGNVSFQVPEESWPESRPLLTTLNTEAY